MLITQSSTASNQSGVESIQFQMKASAHAFRIISSSLYTNKHQAVLRELASNAYDAQLINNVTTPIRIQLPTALEPTLVVTDLGTGMNRNQLIELYSTYFSSSKQQSEDAIGGLTC